jgi:hypothetical protein
MKTYVIINKISNLVVWRGTEEEAKQATWFNPFLKTEEMMKIAHSALGNEVFVKI